MKVLKNDKYARLITIAVVIMATIFGVHKSVNKEARKIEAQFYSGVYVEDEKYTQPSIAAQLERRTNTALGIVTVAGNYDEAAGAAKELDEKRIQLMEAESITDKYLANTELQKSYEQIRELLAGSSLSPRDEEGLNTYYSTMDGAQGIISNSYYNLTVSRFTNGILGAFPVNILKYISFVRYPEYFGVEG